MKKTQGLLLDKIENLPENSGVYIMRDAAGDVIYVGKAVVLKNRVRQYFFNTQKHPKVQAMVDNVADFDYIITLTEKDALSLESNLIKKYKPKYNILLKDDKASPFIKIDMSQEFPTVEVTRKVKKDGARYFGPFMGISVWDVVAVIRSAYGMRTCPKKLKKNTRECLNYHIGLCLAPCTGRVDKQRYDSAVKDVVAFLSGRDDTAYGLIEQRMNRAAENEQFEQAIYYRDKLQMLAKMKEKTIANLTGGADLDAFAYASNGEFACVSVCLVRGGKMMGVKNFVIPDVSLSEREAVEGFMRQYYMGANTDLPPQLCVAYEPEANAALTDYLYSLKGVRPELIAPKIGTKRKLLETALSNAEDYLVKSAEKTRRERDMSEGAAAKLAEILGIKSARRMECYDISNISGVDKVASMVVFVDGRESRSDYRRFKIKTVEGANDFMSMNETIRRRFRRAAEKDDKFSELPDLVVIDGGKGQLSAAYSAMNSEGFDVPMVGLAKREEELFTVFDERPIVLSKASYPLRLLQRIRDEAHRFAITYHRNLRSKRYGSSLEDIPGVGEVKRRLLLKTFGSIENIKAVSLSDLEAVNGLDSRTAKNIYAYFHKQDDQDTGEKKR